MEAINKIFDEIEKIAGNFNIKEADSIVLNFKKDYGILKFKKAVDQTATGADSYNPLPDSQAAPAIPQNLNEQNIDTQNASSENQTQPQQQVEEPKKEEPKKEEPNKEQKNIMDDPEVQNAMNSVESKFGSLSAEVDAIIQQGKEEFKEGNPEQLPQFLENKLKEAGILEKIEQASQDPDMQKLINLTGAKGEKPSTEEQASLEAGQPNQQQTTQQQPVAPA